MFVEDLFEQALREGRFSIAGAAAADDRSRAQLLVRLSGIQREGLAPDESLEHALNAAGSVVLSQFEANVLYFCDQVFEQCQLQTDLESSLLDGFVALRPLVAIVLLSEGDVLQTSRHPLFLLLDQWWDAGRYWSPDLGKPGDKYLVRLTDLLATLRNADYRTISFQALLDELSGQLAKDHQRAETLVGRICQTAKGALAGQQAEQVVRQQISALLASMPMPDAVEELLKGPLRDSMRVIYLSQGPDSDEWSQIIRAAQMMLESVQNVEGQAATQHLYQIVPKVIPLLTRCLVSISDESVMEEWMAGIEQLHMQLLLGKQLELHAADPLSAIESEPGVSANVSSALVEQVSSIREGQWLVYDKEGGEKMRCRLALKMADAGQLIFVNVLGAKCLEKSVEEFAYLLTARHVRLLDADNNFSQIFRDTVSNFLRLYQSQALLMSEAAERERIETERRSHAQQKARLEADRIAQDQLAAQLRAEEEARLHAEEAARQAEVLAKMAAEKARLAAEEAKRVADEAAKLSRQKDAQDAEALAKRIQLEEGAERERALQEEKLARINEWESVQQSVRSLGIGAWVDIEINGECQRCKLAAVINASDKLIFVGRDGRKLVEPRRDELIKLLLDGKARIVQQGDNFENSLARVIQTLRKD
jgi:hypothetical protein